MVYLRHNGINISADLSTILHISLYELTKKENIVNN